MNSSLSRISLSDLLDEGGEGSAAGFLPALSNKSIPRKGGIINDDDDGGRDGVVLFWYSKGKTITEAIHDSLGMCVGKQQRRWVHCLSQGMCVGWSPGGDCCWLLVLFFP